MIKQMKVFVKISTDRYYKYELNYQYRIYMRHCVTYL